MIYNLKNIWLPFLSLASIRWWVSTHWDISYNTWFHISKLDMIKYNISSMALLLSYLVFWLFNLSLSSTISEKHSDSSLSLPQSQHSILNIISLAWIFIKWMNHGMDNSNSAWILSMTKRAQLHNTTHSVITSFF